VSEEFLFLAKVEKKGRGGVEAKTTISREEESKGEIKCSGDVTGLGPSKTSGEGTGLLHDFETKVLACGAA